MNQTGSQRTDWSGRTLGLLALIVAAGSSAYFHVQHQSLVEKLAAIEPTDATDARHERADAFNQRWDDQLTSALADFKQRANEAVEKNAEATVARQLEFRNELAAMRAEVSRVTSAVPAYDVEDLVEAKYRELREELSSPRLRLAHNLMKPLSNADAGWVVIKNDGHQEAGLASITFSPHSQFEVDPADDQGARLAGANPMIVRFRDEDNTATEPGRHADYVQVFDTPRIVPGDGYFQVRLEIVNAAHRGWGLRGELTLRYDGGRQLKIPDVSVVFVPDPTAGAEPT